MSTFVKDPSHWLFRFSPEEWVFAGLGEAERAAEAYARGDGRGGLAQARRGAGMALNALVILEPEKASAYGRTYMEHLSALRADGSAPEAVRAAAAALIDAPSPGQTLIVLRVKASPERLVEAAKDVVAHAYARVVREKAAAEKAS